MTRNPIRRTGLVLLTLSLLLPLSPLSAEDEKDLRELLRDALYTEEVTRDPEAAAKQYEALLSQHDAQRAFAASALFRLAEVRRKQDRKDEAIALYQKLLARFPEAETEAKLARENLAVLGAKSVEARESDKARDYEQQEIERLRELATASPDLLSGELLSAINSERVKVVEFLLSHGVDSKASHALGAAVERGNLTICKMLLKQGKPSPEVAGNALSQAARMDRIAILNFLLEEGLDANSPVPGIIDVPLTPLFIAVEVGNLKAATALLDHGADIDFMAPSGGDPEQSPYVGTPLHLSVKAQKGLPIFRFLLERGAKPDLPTPNAGVTPLHMAAWAGEADSVEMVKELLARGADPNRSTTLAQPPDRATRTFATVTPFELALRAEAKAKIEAMLAKGANPSHPGSDGRTLLSAALRTKDTARIELLLRWKVDPNVADTDGSTPLAYACTIGDKEIARRLLEAGADPNKAKGRLTPLSIATRNDIGWPIVELLLAKGANPEAATFKKAVDLSKWDVAMRLLDAGAPLSDPSNPLPGESSFVQALKSADALPLIKRMVAMGAKPDEAWIKSGFRRDSGPLIPSAVRSYLFRTFMLPQSEDSDGIRLVGSDGNSSMLSLLEEKSPSGPPKPLAQMLFDPKDELRWSALPGDRLTIWRKSNGAWKAAHEFALSDDFPALEWGDVIELSDGPEDSKRPTSPFSHWDAIDELKWELRRRISIPVTVEIDGKAQEVTLRGDRLVFDPATPREIPLGGARSVIALLWQPEIAFEDSQLSKVELAIRREGWPDVKLPFESSGKDFPLQAGDRISLNAPAESDEVKLQHRRSKVAVTVPNAPFSRTFGVERFTSVNPIRRGDPVSVPAGLHQQTIPSLLQALAEVIQDPSLDKAPSDPALLPAWLSTRGTNVAFLQRPDFSRLRIRRLLGDGSEKVIDVDLAKIIAETPEDAAPELVRQRDVVLESGDIVEVPVLPADDKTPWTGLSGKEASFFSRALSCRVQLTDSQGGVSLKEVVYRAPRIVATPAGLVPLPPSEGTSSLVAWIALLPPNRAAGASFVIHRDSLEKATLPAADIFLRDGDRLAFPQMLRVPVLPPPSR